jgi:hypothetical protein
MINKREYEMRTLSPTLLAAQQAASHTPWVKIEVKNKITGVTRLTWERLYQGTESDYYHGLTLAGDGSLIRVRITPPSDGCKLYRQRITNPGPQCNFSTWTYTNEYDCQAIAAASYNAEVSIFWINGSRELRRIRSTDYGASWLSPELIDYSPSTDVHGLAAAYKSNGDLAVFFTDQMTLYIKKRISGNWQTKAAWDKSTGSLSSIAAVYNSDWDLLVTGQDSNGNYKVWSLIYGDGGEGLAGVWSNLKELASAPAGGDFEYSGVFMDKPDVYRAFFIEKFSGIQSYNRPFWTYSIPNTGFTDSLWCEPVPFNLSSGYGLAISHFGNYCWLSNTNGVWRSSLVEASLDVSADILSVKCETLPKESRLLIDLRNDDGRYRSPGEGYLYVLKIGSQIEFSPGYVTALGKEASPGIVFWLDGWEYINSGNNSCFTLHAVDGWHLLGSWRARHQFRWNKDSNEMSVKRILEFVLARVGLKLEVQSQSSVITGFYPDFAIHPDDSGDIIVMRLLSFVPDMVYIEGVKAFLVNPQSSDSPVYCYGQAHSIFQGKYHSGSWLTNQVHIEGYDADNAASIITDSFSWQQMDCFSDRIKTIADRNIGTVAAGQTLAGAYLRKVEIAALDGMIRVPVNCGQQLYDVIDITDDRAGLSGAKRRVMGLLLSYQPTRGEYEQKLLLGGV